MNWPGHKWGRGAVETGWRWVSQQEGVWNMETDCVVPWVESSRPGRTMFPLQRSEEWLSLLGERTEMRHKGALGVLERSMS